MATFIKHINSANEKNIDQLLNEIREWDKKLQISSQAFAFLHELITADIFQRDLPNLYENLFTYSSTMLALKNEKISLHQEIVNHKNDLNGMLECEDISCETFYYSQHENLHKKLLRFLSDFHEFQAELFKFCSNKLLKRD